MASDHAVDIDRHVRIYITVFVALMVLTIVTVAVSRFHLPLPIAVSVALLAVSVLSASYPAWGPWRQPWFYNWMDAHGLLPY